MGPKSIPSDIAKADTGDSMYPQIFGLDYHAQMEEVQCEYNTCVFFKYFFANDPDSMRKKYQDQV